MSNELPLKPSRNLAGLRKLKTVDDMRQWLETDTNTMEEYFKLLKDTFDNFGMGTANWNIREVTQADVDAGNAALKGNLIAEHKTNGTKHEFQQG